MSSILGREVGIRQNRIRDRKYSGLVALALAFLDSHKTMAITTTKMGEKARFANPEGNECV
jgi:hypothetical protein